LFKVAKVAVMHSLYDAYKSRRLRKRDMRRLWITRIGAAAIREGLSYSRLMGGLRKGNVALDRKILADIAACDPDTFAAVAKFSQGNS
jgi:large subunit ribosomal protein L20